LTKIGFSLSQKAKNHIEEISKQLPIHQNWINDQIGNCTIEYDAVSRITDFNSYLSCISSAIANFIERSNFDYNYRVELFADHAVFELIQSQQKLTYDKICMLAIMGYVNSPKIGDVLNRILKQFETEPYKFNKSNLVNYIYLWKKGDIDDFTLIQKIFTYWVNFLIKAKIKFLNPNYEGSSEDKKAIKNEVEEAIDSKL